MNNDPCSCTCEVEHQRSKIVSSASSKLMELLLCLPALRQADQLIRQYWTRVHRETQTTQTRQKNNVKMNKLFVEMLEASMR